MVKNKSIFTYADKLDNFLMIIGGLGSIGDGLQNPLMLFVVGRLINDYATFNSTISSSSVDRYALKLLFVALGVGLSAFAEGLCWARTADRQTARMRVKYLKSILRQDVAFFDTQSDDSSRTYQVISTIMSDSISIRITIGEKIPDCIASMSSSFFCFLFAFLLSWRLTLTAIPLTIGFIIPVLIFAKTMNDISTNMNNSYGVAGGIAEQAISSIRTVFSYVAEKQTLEYFNNALQKTLDLGIKQGLYKGLMLGSVGVIFGGWAIEAWVGSILVAKKGEKGGDVVVAGLIVCSGGISILSVLPNLSAIIEATAAATRINDMINMENTAYSEEKRGGKALSYVKGEIEFKNVYFNYPSRPDTPILQGLNLKVRAGKAIGLVGGSGSGKSTIISLLQRFYEPIQGEILLDGHNIKKVHLKWLRSQMGLVNQEPILFATSIKENILFGKEGATMTDIVTSAKAANAHDFVMNLPDAYETQVGQFGLQLSGGQKQRIAIARALIRDPKILLLDEATSALDAQSENIVQEAIGQALIGRTTIVIAHSISSIRTADLIVVLESGKVVESGKHEELMQINGAKGGLYFKMVQLQQSSVKNEVSINSHQVNEINSRRISAPPSPSSARSSGSYYSFTVAPSPMSKRFSIAGTTNVYPFSDDLSMSGPQSIQFSDSFRTQDKDIYQPVNASLSKLRLLKMNSPEWHRALLGCIGALGYGACPSIHAYCIGALFSIYFRTDKSGIISQARVYYFIFLGVGVLAFFSNLLQHYNFSIMGESLTKRVREKLLEKIMTFEVGWFDQDENTSAAICARLSTEANMVRSLVGDRMSLLAQTIFSATFAYTLGIFLSWRLALVMISAQPLVIISYYSRSVLMKNMSGKIQKAQREGSQLASEAVVNHRTITAFSSQKRIVELFIETLEGPRKESIRQSWFSGFGLFSSQFLMTASTALSFWYAGRLMIQGLITPERLFQAFLVLVFTGISIADAGSLTKDLSQGSNAVKSVFATLDRISEIDPGQSGKIDAQESSIRGNVELKSVSFAYPLRPDQLIFKGLSLKIAGGTTMALVGQSGCGKSTVIGLIERFYDPLKGSVFIDGRNVKDYGLRSLRAHIGLVSQEPTLFGGTISENISYGKNGATESEIRKAARIANADDFISGMKDGYDTYCGERGVQLSGGQKQRIALARAIIKNPSILLLDEATSALDSVSENLVQEALEKMMVGRTCIVVAHRLSTIKNANCIAVIKDGIVVEQGSHSELLSLGHDGTYHSLVNLQQCSHSGTENE